ncbi:GlsB/YeaQ/YmgE family stress response membrane protein, partial [Levilactobacillus brevis]|nr:GlsB/YeaQ/YmgE family stress response membrane protein [Levilactobacillus brevis]
MFGWLWSIIVGAIIGTIAGAITNKGGSMGWI